LDRADLLALSLDLNELKLAGTGEALILNDSVVEASDLPLLAGGETLQGLIESHPHRLLSAGPFRVAARGASLSAGPAQLGDYELVFSSRDGELTAAITKGRLEVRSKDPGAPTRAISMTLAGEALMSLEGHAAGRAARRLPLGTLTATKLRLSTNQVRLATAHGDYRFANMTLRAEGLPLIVDGRPLDFSRPQDLITAGLAGRLSLAGRDIEHRTGSLDSFSLTLFGEGNRLLLEDMLVQVEDTSLSAEGQVEPRGRTNPWRFRLAGDGVRLAPLTAWFGAPFQARGDLTLTLDLQGTGFDRTQIRDSIDGRVQLDAEDIRVEGVDLDQVLTYLERTQTGGLLDIAAYALAGPAGPLLVTTSRLNNLIRVANARGRSRLLQVRSDLEIDRGTVRIQDVAMLTTKHRLAVKGSLSTDPHGPLDLQIATVDRNGCPIYREKLGGTLAAPNVSDATLLLKALARPARSVLDVLQLTLPRSCNQPFYTGAVQHREDAEAWKRAPRARDEGPSRRGRKPPPKREPRGSEQRNLFLDHDF
jgi:hypothetical protein